MSTKYGTVLGWMEPHRLFFFFLFFPFRFSIFPPTPPQPLSFIEYNHGQEATSVHPTQGLPVLFFHLSDRSCCASPLLVAAEEEKKNRTNLLCSTLA